MAQIIWRFLKITCLKRAVHISILVVGTEATILMEPYKSVFISNEMYTYFWANHANQILARGEHLVKKVWSVTSLYLTTSTFPIKG